jgi:hypothetical protein
MKAVLFVVCCIGVLYALVAEIAGALDRSADDKP